MYNFDHRDKFYYDERDEYLVITADVIVDQQTMETTTITFTSDDILDGTFELFENLGDFDSLNLQNCFSSYIKFSTKYIEYSLLQSIIYVQRVIVIGESEYEAVPIGTFIVYEDNLSNDGITQDIVAYDALYSIVNADPQQVKDIYNSLEFPVTLKDLRDTFLYQFDIEQDDTALINDDIEFPKQIADEDYVAGSDIIKAIAELNGVFPHIGKDGLLHWIDLDVGDIHESSLYPSSTTFPGFNTFPGTGYNGIFIDIYKNQYVENSVIWGNYSTLKPDGLQIRNENNEIAYFENGDASSNPYVVINNFLCYGLNYGTYETIAKRLYKKLKLITYVPFTLNKMADPCIEVGDRVMVHTQENIQFLSYVFSKHTTGLRNPFEDIQTNGTYELSKYDIGKAPAAKLKNLDNRVGNIEKSGSGPLQILSVPTLPDNPQLNVLYLVQGEVTVS